MIETKTPIPIAKPFLADNEVEAVKRPILSGWLTQGPEVVSFEREFAAYVGAEYACAVSSCTTALHLALLAVGTKPGDEIITVSHSFVATANVIRYCGAKPVFVDIESGSFNMDPRLIEKAITKKTRAILCVHQIGMPCDLAAILKIARSHSLPVIEDAACAVGSEIFLGDRWEKIGKPHGDIACFSFHPRKVITTGDGGMITTSNLEWDKKFRLWRQHGMSVSDAARHGAKDVVFESYVELGYNYRLTDVQAAIGREQLKRLPWIVKQRRLLADRYRQSLAGVPGLELPSEPSWARSNWQSFCVRLSKQLNRLKIMQLMLDQSISTRRGIMCIHREDAYPSGTWSCGPEHDSCDCRAKECRFLRESEKAQDHSILLPLYPHMEEGDQDRVIKAFIEACTLTENKSSFIKSKGEI